MKPRTHYILASLAIFLLISFVAVRSIAVPYAQNKARAKLKAMVKSSGADATFKDVKVAWNGLRIIQLKVKRGDDSLRSNVRVSFGLDSELPFIKPTLVTLDRPKIALYRKPSDAKVAKPSSKLIVNEASRPLAELLDRYFTAGISVRLNKANVQILGANSEVLLKVPALNADMNAKDRTAQIATGDFFFKDAKLLSELSGQILLQKQREFYPFLLQARDPGGEPWQLKGQISHDFDSLEVRHKRKGVPEAWSEQLAFVGNPSDVKVLLGVKLEGLMTRDQIDYFVKIASTNLHVQHERLGKTPLGPWPLTLQSRGFFIPETTTLGINSGKIALSSRTKEEPLSLSFEGFKQNLQASMKTDPFRFRFHAADNNCQSVLDALPENLLPLLGDLKLEGKFAVDGEIRLISESDILKLTPGMNRMNCRVIQSPEILTREWLFTQSTEIPDGLRDNPALLAIKMGHPIPRAQIPDDFFKALVAAEDAKFWRHDGILLESLLAALERNVKAGQAVLGGSTITMQLAKNLYLDREKVVSRKVQEIVLAWVLEQNLSKAEILELYANAVEFAPNTYGISKGANIYFNKNVAEMTVAESLFLASILPSPMRNFSESFCRARISRGLKQRMQNVATGLSVLSQERDFMKIYATDMENFSFGTKLGGCDIIDRSRISERQRTDIKRF